MKSKFTRLQQNFWKPKRARWQKTELQERAKQPPCSTRELQVSPSITSSTVTRRTGLIVSMEDARQQQGLYPSLPAPAILNHPPKL